MSTNKFGHKTTRFLGSVCVGMMLCAAPAFGWVETIGANVGPTMTYQAPPTAIWNVPGAPLSDGAVNQNNGSSWYISPSWSSPGALDWTAALDTDLSLNGRARATFQPFGTFAFSGNLYDSNTPGANLVASGSLFEGIMLDFEIAESPTNMNRINMTGMSLVIPSGGWLYDHGYLVDSYVFTFMGVDCQQNSGDLTSFGSDIVTLTVMQFDMVAVPEPASVLLAAAGLLLMRRRSHTV
jgi:hypothetical protein